MIKSLLFFGLYKTQNTFEVYKRKNIELWEDQNQLVKIWVLKVDLMKKVENVRNNNIKHKSFLIITKFIPHISAFMYILYTLLQFADIDAVILGYLLDYSILPWLYIYLASFVFRYCYVHRLPLYYILFNEILTTSDYYLNIPVNDLQLLLIHLVLIGFLIFGYSYYHIKYRIRK